MPERLTDAEIDSLSRLCGYGLHSVNINEFRAVVRRALVEIADLRQSDRELRGHIEKLVGALDTIRDAILDAQSVRMNTGARDIIVRGFMDALTPAVRKIAEQVRKGREEKDNVPD